MTIETKRPKRRKHPTLDKWCVGCQSTECEIHGEANKRGEHVCRPTIVVKESYHEPLAEGTSTKTFVYPICGGGDGCGNVYFHDRWYANPEVHKIYGR